MQDLNSKHFGSKFSLLAREFLLWATTGAGVRSVKKSYEVFKTYGNKILKLAATMMGLTVQRKQRRKQRGRYRELQSHLCNHFHLSRVG